MVQRQIHGRVGDVVEGAQLVGTAVADEVDLLLRQTEPRGGAHERVLDPEGEGAELKEGVVEVESRDDEPRRGDEPAHCAEDAQDCVDVLLQREPSGVDEDFVFGAEPELRTDGAPLRLVERVVVRLVEGEGQEPRPRVDEELVGELQVGRAVADEDVVSREVLVALDHAEGAARHRPEHEADVGDVPVLAGPRFQHRVVERAEQHVRLAQELGQHLALPCARRVAEVRWAVDELVALSQDGRRRPEDMVQAVRRVE